MELLKFINWEQISHFEVNNKSECPDNIVKELTVGYWFERNKVGSH